MHIEQWKPVVGLEGFYEVSDLGRIRTIARMVRCKTYMRPVQSRIRMPSLLRGYPAVNLSANGATKMRTVHVMVLEAFIGPRPSPAHEACHGDGNTLNPVLSNLRLDTKSANKADSFAHGTAAHGARVGNSKLTTQQAERVRSCPGGTSALAKEFGVALSTIKRIRNGRTWSRAISESRAC